MDAAAALDALRSAVSAEDAGRELLMSSDALVPASLPSFWCDPPESWPEEVTSGSREGEPSRGPEGSSPGPEESGRQASTLKGT